VGGEADGVAGVVDACADAADPADAEGVIDRIRPGDAGSAAALREELDPQLGGRLCGAASQARTGAGVAKTAGVIAASRLVAGAAPDRRILAVDGAGSGPGAKREPIGARRRGAGAVEGGRFGMGGLSRSGRGSTGRPAAGGAPAARWPGSVAGRGGVAPANAAPPTTSAARGLTPSGCHPIVRPSQGCRGAVGARRRSPCVGGCGRGWTRP
jgi:hypothetical protein